MSHFRFSLLGLAGLVAIVAMGCAALAYASPILAGAVWLTTFVILSLGAVAAVLRSQPQRSFWIGFAMLGWLYLLTLNGPLTGVGNSIYLNTLLEKAALWMPKSMVTVEDPFASPGGYSDPGMSGMPGGGGMMPGADGMTGGAMPGGMGTTRPTYQTVDSQYIASFTRTAQAILTLLLACLGGFAGRSIQERNASPVDRAVP